MKELPINLAKQRAAEVFNWYNQREETVCIEYFRRKSVGDYSLPVPDIMLFERISMSADAPLLLVTFCEREVRALFFGVGDPVSAAAASELIECLDAGHLEHNAEVKSEEIADMEEEIDSLEDEIIHLRRHIVRLEREEVERVGDYIPDDIQPLMAQLQREGA
jgi:hypothetical protein